VRKPQVKSTLGGHKHRWEENIEMFQGSERKVLAQNREKGWALTNTVENLRVPDSADNSLARPTSRCVLFDGENISFDASLFVY